MKLDSHDLGYFEICFLLDFWIFGLCPSSVILKNIKKNTTFWKLDLFPSPQIQFSKGCIL
jgi:hypothetical protein